MNKNIKKTREIYEANPKNFDATLKYAASLIKYGDFNDLEEASLLLIRLLSKKEFSDSHTRIGLEYARLETRKGNLENAMKLYQCIIDKPDVSLSVIKDKMAAKLELAIILDSLENKEDAKKLLLELFDTENRDYAMHKYATILFGEGNYTEALKYFNMILGSGDEESALSWIAECKRHLGYQLTKK